MRGATSSGTDTAPARPRERKAKITPLPLSQMVPMTIVVMNESICATMLSPFVAPYVAHLRGVSVNEAGYYSGMLIGVFMLGQVVSAKTWGRISDKYGRRFPIISGLFTSGLMMMGFGLSSNVWMCAVFRFFHGLFNGNILVAKTMMADITDTTNQGGGFSFISLCSAFGFLIGPLLGGLLYDPPHSEGLAWANFNAEGFFGKYPAFLTSLVVFIYTNIGMLVCTFLVKESNPNAQPLPGLVRLFYPCMWYRSTPFVKPPIQYEDEEDEQGAEGEVFVVEEEGAEEESGLKEDPSPLRGGIATRRDANFENRSSSFVEDVSQDSQGSGHGSDSSGRRRAEAKAAALDGLPREVSEAAAAAAAMAAVGKVLTASDTTGTSPTYSPVERLTGDRRDFDVAQEMSIMPSSRRAMSAYDKLNFTSPVRKLQEVEGDDDDGEDGYYVSERVVLVEDKQRKATCSRGESISAAAALATGVTDRGRLPVADASEVDEDEEEAGVEEVVTVFGYREAFARPSTSFMLTQYMVLSAADMIAANCFPLWANADREKGGLGLKASQTSYILLANGAPCLMANVMFRVVERYFSNKMGLMRVGLAGAGTAVLLLPFNAYIGSTAFWVYVLVTCCTAGRQVFSSWCYSLNTMLTARAAPTGHVGSIMGINQSCGALVRGIVPFVAAPIFARSISEKHVFPLDHSLVFVASALMFFWVWLRSYGIRTDMDGNLIMA